MHRQPPARLAPARVAPLSSRGAVVQNVCGDLYPRVAIQLPMFNERAVCQAAIDSACEQSWPKGRLIVQVPTLQSLPWPSTLASQRWTSST